MRQEYTERDLCFFPLARSHRYRSQKGLGLASHRQIPEESRSIIANLLAKKTSSLYGMSNIVLQYSLRRVLSMFYSRLKKAQNGLVSAK